MNFGVLPQGPRRSKNFVHVASKQVFMGSISTCCCCKSAIDLPAGSKFPLMMKSWTDQNCQCKTWLLLLLLQPGESGADHGAGGRKRKYSRRTERQLRHSGVLHLLTIRHLHSVCEHCESWDLLLLLVKLQSYNLILALGHMLRSQQTLEGSSSWLSLMFLLMSWCWSLATRPSCGSPES